MSDANKAVVKRFFDEVNKGRRAAFASIDELIAPDYVMHDPVAGELQGRDSLRRFLGEFFDALPDLWMRLDELLAEEGRAVYRFTFGGTHKGSLMGFSPTGKAVQASGICISRISDGKIAENWEIWDAHGLFKQLAGEKVATRVA